MAVLKSRRIIAWCALSAVPIAIILLVFFVLRHSLAPQPPLVTLTDLDPELKEALAAALGNVRERPYSAKDWAHLGQLLRAHSMLEPAGECFARLEKLEPQQPRWPHLAGETLLQRNRAADAVGPLERAVALANRLQPPPFAPRLRLVEALLAAGRIDDAERMILHAAELEPNHPNVHLAAGQAALAREDDASAERHLLRCLDSPTTRQRATALLAGIHLRRGDAKQSVTWSRRAAALPADTGWGDPWVLECQRLAVGKTARYRKLDALEAQGRTRDVVELAQEMLQAGPDAAVQVSLSRNLINLGNYAAAERALREALALTRDQTMATYLLSKAVCAQAEADWERNADKDAALKRFDEAAELARQALRAQPDHAMAHLVLGICLLRQGRRADSIAALRTAATCAPDHPEPALYLAIALTQDGQFAEAERLLDYGQKLAPPGDVRFAKALQALADRK